MRSVYFSTLSVLFFAGCGGIEPEVHDHADDFADNYENLNRGDGCSAVRLIDDENHSYGGMVSLSFDDGPSEQTTDVVLDILAEHNIRATFFINGKNVHSANAERILRRITSEGHTLGNHTQHHLHLRTQRTSVVRSEIDQTTDVLRAAGVEPKYLRFPYGDASCNDIRTATDRGYAVTGWTVDTADWCFNSANPKYGGYGACVWKNKQGKDVFPPSFRNDYIGYTMDQVASHNGGLILMHDIKDFTVSKLDMLIRRLKSDGYRFTTIDDAAVFPRLNQPFERATTTLTPGTCQVQAGGARGFEQPSFDNAVSLYNEGTILSLVSSYPTNNFYEIYADAGYTDWVWADSLVCNVAGSSPPPQQGSCTVTSDWGARAFTGPNFGDSYGVIPQYATVTWLDATDRGDGFYRVNPGIGGVAEAFVYEGSVSCSR